MTDFFEVAGRQRAHRRFTDAPVSDDAIARILDAATRAPSAENRQPWEFVVVRDEATRAELRRLALAAWDAGGRAFAEGRLDAGLLAAVDAGMRDDATAAPVMIVVAADLERGLRATVGSSIFPCVQNLLLAATALGLGSALTTIATGFGAELQALLGLPQNVEPVAVIPLGWPVRPLGPPRRDPFGTHTHRDRYGSPW